MLDLKNLRESVNIEGKKASNTLPKSIWETYSAFCNTLGGYIILGVEENESGQLIPTGVDNVQSIIKDFWSIINNVQKISMNLLTDEDVIIQKYNDKDIIVIHVPMAPRQYKPVYINNNLLSGTYRRDGDGDYHCSKLEISNMLRDQSDRTQDFKIVDNSSIRQIDKESLASYRARFDKRMKNHTWSELDDEEFLYRINGMDRDKNGDLRLTEAGLLMFGYEYEIVKKFADYILDYEEILDDSIRWTNRIKSDDMTWSGNIYDFFFRIIPLINEAFPAKFELDRYGERISESKASIAVREGLINCICNANFYDAYGVVIRRYPKKIIFTNSGVLRVPVEKVIKGGYSDARNKAIMKMFSLIGYSERAGSGIPQIYAVWKENGWPEPKIIQEFNHDRTTLELEILPALKKTEKEMIENPYISKIYDYMLAHDKVKSKDIAELLDVKDARARQLLKEMVNEDIVLAIGANRNRMYMLKK